MAMATMGEQFARALAEKDFGRVTELLDPEVDFRALTPRKAWEATGPAQVISEVLEVWFGDRVAVLMVLEDILQTCRFRRAPLATQIPPTREGQRSAHLLQRHLRVFPPTTAACAAPRTSAPAEQGSRGAPRSPASAHATLASPRPGGPTVV